MNFAAVLKAVLAEIHIITLSRFVVTRRDQLPPRLLLTLYVHMYTESVSGTLLESYLGEAI